MARIELKFCTVRMKDGLSGTGLVNQPVTAPVLADTALTIDTVVLNTYYPAKVPVGARFRIAGETTPVDHVVTSRTQGSGSGTNEQQTVTLTSCTTHFTLTLGGKETSELDHEASNAEVKAALVALDDGYEAADFTVTGSAGGPYTVTFTGALGNAPQSLLVGSADTGSIAIVRTVLGVVPPATTTTLAIVFSPALGAGTYADGAVLTFKPQQIDIKMGEGNATYTEHRDYQYLLDRGLLDTVREPKDVPMDVKIDGVYEHITSIAGEFITPIEALKGSGRAAEWVSSSSDQCEPYCIDLEVAYEPPCAPSQAETTLFPMFRAETREFNLSAATINLTGKCKAKEPIITRPNA
jgi:hypothetical protein